MPRILSPLVSVMLAVALCVSGAAGGLWLCPDGEPCNLCDTALVLPRTPDIDLCGEQPLGAGEPFDCRVCCSYAGYEVRAGTAVEPASDRETSSSEVYYLDTFDPSQSAPRPATMAGAPSPLLPGAPDRAPPPSV